MTTAPAWLRALRVRQWLKNGFVLVPALFSGHALSVAAMGRAGAAAVAFCLAASAAYLINDVLDREADRADPVKRMRPIAAGEISAVAALLLAVGLIAAGVLVAVVPGSPVVLALAAYVVLTTAYSWTLKTVPVLEAMVLAAGFVIRLVAGALAIPVTVSHWLVICGFLLALLLAFGKRLPELRHSSSRNPSYPESFLRAVVAVLAAVTVVAYVLYTVSPDTVANVGSDALLATTPLVLFGVLRYLLLLHREGAQDPTAALFADRPLMATVVVWALLAGLIVSRSMGSGPP